MWVNDVRGLTPKRTEVRLEKGKIVSENEMMEGAAVTTEA